MDCFLTAFRVYSSKKFSRSGVTDADDATWGFARKAFSRSSSSSTSCSEEGHGASSDLKRQSAAAFFMRFYVCGMKTSARDEDAMDGNAEFLFEVGLQSGEEQSRKSKEEKQVLQWWEESSKKRRKLGSEEWVSGENNGNLLRRAPARLKRLIRRVRAKVRKMAQVQKAVSFHYDPLSYAMNFDDGCWQQCEAHAKLFHTSLAYNSESPCSSQENCKV